MLLWLVACQVPSDCEQVGGRVGDSLEGPSLAHPPSVQVGSPPASGADDEGVRPLFARLAADVVAGPFPLEVSFDAAGSDLGAGPVRYEWSFGDGAEAIGGARATWTYVGEGAFEATLTLVEERTGAVSEAAVTIDVSTPECPSAAPPIAWGEVEDGELEEVSGLAASRVDADAWWVEEDSGNAPVLTAIDAAGATLSRHELPDDFADFEDLEAAVDPRTGVSMLFLGDIGDNGESRDEVAVWVVEEPHPRVDGALSPLRMGLTYPDAPRNAETLLVDPLTLDVYIVTKDGSATRLYVKRAPHDDPGPFVLEDLGEKPTMPLVATGGSVSADGSRVVVRDYGATAQVWMRDGYLPLEDAFDAEPCPVGIQDEQQGEAIAFTADGAGLVTVSEGVGPTLWYIGL